MCNALREVKPSSVQRWKRSCCLGLEPGAPSNLFSAPLETALLPSATLAEFYRFALLLTGHIGVAEQVMAETLAEVEAQLGSFRHECNRNGWLALRIRERCMKKHANGGDEPSTPRLLREQPSPQRTEILEIEAYIVAQHFHALPEPERTTLALFYLDLFSAEEIARLMKVTLEELGDTLARARALLQESLRALRSAS